MCYRLPREPSTPRITVWRKLRRLGVAQLADGLVTLPHDPRTREQLEWIADEVIRAGGQASLWLATPTSVGHEQELAHSLATARASEYQAVIAEANAALAGEARARQRTGTRLRSELRRIERRDFFPPAERDEAQAAVRALLAEPAPAQPGPAGDEVRA